MPEIVLIWAQGRNGAIGVNGRLPWHLPEDLAHFKETTRGQTVVMGRKTWESLPKSVRPLPGRKNIVLTRGTLFSANTGDGYDPHNPSYTLNSLTDAAMVTQTDKLFVIGGAEIYREAMAIADRLIVTQIDSDFPDADAFAPEIDAARWSIRRTREPKMYSNFQTSSTGLRFRITEFIPRIIDDRFAQPREKDPFTDTHSVTYGSAEDVPIGVLVRDADGDFHVRLTNGRFVFVSAHDLAPMWLTAPEGEAPFRRVDLAKLDAAVQA